MIRPEPFGSAQDELRESASVAGVSGAVEGHHEAI